MKKIILLLLISFSGFSQKIIYNKVKTSGNFTEYQDKNGNILKIGDTITIGYPKLNNFMFITQGNTPVAAFMANKKVVVSKIKSIGTKKIGYKVYMLFGGYGFSCYVNYEAALETEEIKNNNISPQ